MDSTTWQWIKRVDEEGWYAKVRHLCDEQDLGEDPAPPLLTVLGTRCILTVVITFITFSSW